MKQLVAGDVRTIILYILQELAHPNSPTILSHANFPAHTRFIFFSIQEINSLYFRSFVYGSVYQFNAIHGFLLFFFSLFLFTIIQTYWDVKCTQYSKYNLYALWQLHEPFTRSTNNHETKYPNQFHIIWMRETLWIFWLCFLHTLEDFISCVNHFQIFMKTLSTNHGRVHTRFSVSPSRGIAFLYEDKMLRIIFHYSIDALVNVYRSIFMLNLHHQTNI